MSKYLQYEVSYDGGSHFIVARSDEEALRLFAELWLEYGDEPPEAWISARWAMS